MFIYVLKLHDDAFYVGRTENVAVRVRAHFDGDGAAWTKLHRPISVCETFDSDDPLDEDKTTLKYMREHGVDKVRGGSFCRVTLSNTERAAIQQMLRGGADKCFKCGESGHFVRECPSQAYEPWSHEEDEQLIDEHARGMSLEDMSRIHRRTQGAIRSRLQRVETLRQPLISPAQEEEECCCLLF